MQITSQRNENSGKWDETLPILQYQLTFGPGGGGGGTPIWNRRGCSSEILNLTPKGDHLGVAQGFRDP